MTRYALAVLLVALGSFSSPAGAEEPLHSPNMKQVAKTRLEWPREQIPDGFVELAFRGRLVIAGLRDYVADNSPTGPEGGVGIFRITKGRPYLRQLSVVPCQTSGEITVIGDVVVAGVLRDHDPSRAGERCNRNGLMIIDISDPRRPEIAKFIGLGCGVIEHTVIRKGPRAYVVTGRTCDEQLETPTNAGALEMAIVRVHPNRPRASREVGNPTDEGISCLELFVFAPRDLMGCLTAGGFTLFDITDPVNPQPILGPNASPVHVGPHGFALTRGSFTWDGQYMILGGGGGIDQQCPGDDDPSLFFYNIEDLSNPVLAGDWAVPRRGSNRWIGMTDDCLSGGFNVVPTKNAGRYVMAAGFGSQGAVVVDFSDPAEPREIGFHLARYWPHDQTDPSDPDPWLSARIHAAYWYNGRIYATAQGENIPRLRVFEIEELGHGSARYFRGSYNPQTQIESVR